MLGKRRAAGAALMPFLPFSPRNGKSPRVSCAAAQPQLPSSCPPNHPPNQILSTYNSNSTHSAMHIEKAEAGTGKAKEGAGQEGVAARATRKAMQQERRGKRQ